MSVFKLKTELVPRGDQPHAIESLLNGFKSVHNEQVLLGVTGSGKTFTAANVIQRLGLPALVIAPNKTLAAQLFSEFKELFPENSVEFFISYYDYYQPEAYIPSTNTYIEKDSSINEQIDRMRHSATSSVLARRDVIVVASVSCIYGLGSPEEYEAQRLVIKTGLKMEPEEFLRALVNIQYSRDDNDLRRGTFRSMGTVVDVFPADQSKYACRIDFWDDTVDSISVIDPYLGNIVAQKDEIIIYPGTHYVTSSASFSRAMSSIETELEEWSALLEKNGKTEEAKRILKRTRFDLEMLRQTNFCPGIENYSRHFDGRQPGEPPHTLLDYFKEDFLVFIDESHIAVPQLRGMCAGDRSRKQTLVDFGFRLPSALDNRPLDFDEFKARVKKVIYCSATPAEYELRAAGGAVTEQIIRPTGLVDPEVEVRPAKGQVKDLLEECAKVISCNGRVLATTLTKKMAEELTDYMMQKGFKVSYIHSDVDTLQRTDILQSLRKGTIDILVGINLLREGLDLPEVTLVAVLDADKEGFLRSQTALIQVCGRAARNKEGRVILYCDVLTGSIQRALDEMKRRRVLQVAYNEKHGITPRSVEKKVGLTPIEAYKIEWDEACADVCVVAQAPLDSESIRKEIKKLKAEMKKAANQFDFLTAARMRDRVQELELREISFKKLSAV